MVEILIFRCASVGSYPAVVAAAIEVVETKRSQHGTTLTLKKLAKFLSNGKGAICHSEFELIHFGWPLPANMLKGNPKRKRTDLDDCLSSLKAQQTCPCVLGAV
ncbi:TPA: hypothetical protein ACH3X1_014028 [Trebouxia sp. C0004]